MHQLVTTITAACIAMGTARAQPGSPAPFPTGHRQEAPPGAAHQAARSGADFLPSKHGFPFRNGFRGCSLPPVLRDLPGPMGRAVRESLKDGLKLPESFGLCGGMALAAADFYLAERAVPGGTTAPKEGSALYEYIFRRQNDSLGQGAMMALKFMQWMALPDFATEGDSTGSLTAAEMPAIVARLQRHELVPLGLVYRKAKGNQGSDAPAGVLWENHQVLAYGVREEAGTKGWVIQIYDSNFPGDDANVIRVTAHPPTGATGGAKAPSREEVSCEQVPGRGRPIRVRGVFAMPYTPVTPPGELDGTHAAPAKPGAPASPEAGATGGRR